MLKRNEDEIQQSASAKFSLFTMKLFETQKNITNKIVHAFRQIRRLPFSVVISISLWIFKTALPLSRSSPIAFLRQYFKRPKVDICIFFLTTIFSKHVNISRQVSSSPSHTRCYVIISRSKNAERYTFFRTKQQQHNDIIVVIKTVFLSNPTYGLIYEF